MCFIGIANAQNGDSQRQNQLIKASTTAQNVDSVVTFEVKTDIQKVAIDLNAKVFKNEVKKESIMIFIDKDAQTLSLSIDTNKVKLSEVEKLLNDKGYILMPKIKIVKETVDSIPTQLIEKYSLEIDKFLNLEDTTIFTSNFKTYNLQEVHPSRRNYYQLVQKIHDFGERLKLIENNLSSSKIDEVVKQFKVSVEGARKLLLEEAKTAIDTAEKDLDTLFPFGKELEVLSPEQKQHYNALIDKFNVLYAKINP